MYQVPVFGLEKIRKTRKNVKSILCEFGLEECTSFSQPKLLEDDPVEVAFNNTDWIDLTDGFHFRGRKKWKYRTQALCCSLCKYTARSWNSFHAHIKCYHPEEKSSAFLSACSACSFIGHPRVLKRHFALFHSDAPKLQVASSDLSSLKSASIEKYVCRKCPYEDSLLYCIKKHVLFRHSLRFWHMYAGLHAESEKRGDSEAPSKKYICKKCGTTAETTEHLVYHLLTSNKHKDLESHLHGLIWQKLKLKKAYPPLVPKAQLTVGIKPLSSDSCSTVEPAVPAPGMVLQGLSSGTDSLLGVTTALPAQAAALVQLASAEAKGLLRPDPPMIYSSTEPTKGPGTSYTLGGLPPTLQEGQTTLHQTVVANKSLPMAVDISGTSSKSHVMPLQGALPQRATVTIPGQGLSSVPPLQTSVTQNQNCPRATMLTSQSLLSHLIPTGNKVNGLPTYTLAPLQVNMSVQSGKGSIVSKVLPPVSQNSSAYLSNTSLESGKTKKWTTCRFCKELFPSAVYHVHMEIHKLKSKTGLAARAPFLKKMPDKTVKCMMCKTLLSEKGLFEHMQHGMTCLYCPGMFYSIKHLVEHVRSDHTPLQKENCDFMRKEYRLYSDERCNLLFPYFDINTTAPKEILGEHEVNMALVTYSLDLIFVKMLPTTTNPFCQTSSRTSLKQCPFCSKELMSGEDYRIHLREKHLITPTIHAILKTPAYKCVYCGGVYTGKTTTKAITVHLQRCKCAPKTTMDAERLINMTRSTQILQPTKLLQISETISDELVSSNSSVKKSKSNDSSEDAQRKLRLELAVKEAIEANKREREARAVRRKQEKEKQVAFSSTPSVTPDIPVDPAVKLALDPADMWKRSFEDRREFLTKYFHKKPYLTKTETTALASQLLLNKSDVACYFGTKRTKCMRAIQRQTSKVLLGFNMAELRKVKHNLFVPEIEPEQEIDKSSSDSDGKEDGESETQNAPYEEEL